MKTMKISLITLLLFLTACLLSAQEYKISVMNTEDGKLIIKYFSGKLTVEGYSGNDIIITSISEELSLAEKSKGLKPIYSAGTDNTGMGLDIKKNENQVIVTYLLQFTNSSEFKIRVPDNLALEFESSREGSNKISVEKMKNEIEISLKDKNQER